MAMIPTKGYSNYGGFQGYQGVVGNPGIPGPSGYTNAEAYKKFEDIQKSISDLGFNLEKLFALPPEDKKIVFQLYEDLMSLLYNNTYTTAEIGKVVFIYNTLYRADYLATDREQKLANLLS